MQMRKFEIPMKIVTNAPLRHLMSIKKMLFDVTFISH